MGRLHSEGKIPEKIDDLRALFEIVERGKITWEATFDAILDPVLIINKNYQIERANLAAADRSGLSVREMVGKRCYEVFAERQDICPRCPLQKTISSRAPHMVDIDRLRRSSDFQVNSYPLSLDAEEPSVVHHYRDVTGEKMLQKKLIQSEKMAAIGMLSGGIAHEINNPLGGILAFAQLLQSELPPDSPTQEDVKEIQEAALRCKKIVADLLAFARPATAIEKSPHNLSQLVERVLPLLRLNLKTKGISIRTDYDKNLPPVWGEGNRLQQVFLNLIQNAAESMKNGGEVLVRTELSADRSEGYVEVRDAGHGISPENMARIFDPFFTTKGIHGTGLGLAICDSIINDHHGRIEVKSEIGQGSLFRVILPIYSREAETTEEIYAPVRTHRGR
ncbi:MAG: PAS domain-containing protein [Deltaproteobacteria bacterium]|nr:PAS domain-containing protein [Deltaproteobacteria bacterium]